MTILQLEYVIACMQQRSINKAAAKLMVSPSNLSKTLLSLEAELGYPIFERRQGGIVPTVPGELFLQHALSIMNELRQIDKIDQSDVASRLYVVSIPFSPVNEAFAQTIVKCQEKKAIQLRLDTSSSEQAVARLEAAHDHIAVVSVSAQKESSFISFLKTKKIKAVELLRTPMCINLRQGHPALDALSKGVTVFIDALQNYPYLNYESDNGEAFGTAGDDLKSSLLYKCSRLVCVSDRGWKNDLLKTTNCFTFGVNSRLFSDDSRIVSVETAYEQIAIMALYVNKGKLPQLAAEFIPIMQQSIAKRVETISHGTNQ